MGTLRSEVGATSGTVERLHIVPGDVLAGKYEVERILGQGGMGQVLCAMHLQLRERVAIKVLLPGAAVSDEARARFLREAQSTAKLRSEHVARVIDVGTLDDGLPYIVMEYLEGHDLQATLRACGPLPVYEAVDLMLQAMEGVAEAHAQGVIHRDLKPSNLFVSTARDGAQIVKVLDFGISKSTSSSDEAIAPDLTQTSSVIGSPLYMSPEQIRSAKNVDSRTDVWSLGVILYELLTGRSVWTAQSASALCAMIAADPPPPMRTHRPELPEQLDKLVLRALEKKLEDRIQDVATFAAELSQFAPTPENRTSANRISRLLSTTGGRTRTAASGNMRVAAVEVADTLASPSSRISMPVDVAPERTTPPIWAIATALLGVCALAGALFVRSSPPTPREPEAVRPSAAAPAVVVATSAATVAPPAPVAPVPAASVAPAASSAAAPSARVPTRVPAKPSATAGPNPFADRE